MIELETQAVLFFAFYLCTCAIFDKNFENLMKSLHLKMKEPNSVALKKNFFPLFYLLYFEQMLAKNENILYLLWQQPKRFRWSANKEER